MMATDFEALFGDVSFNTPLPSVNEDEVLAMLSPAPTAAVNLAVDQQRPLSERTKGGAERVNANSASTGVTATKDANGRVTLSNTAAASPSPTPKPEIKISEVPNTVANLLNQLKTATDIDTARGVYSTFQSAAVAEITKLEQQALTFANNKLGIPQLEINVRAAEASNKASIGYYPGIGDAPNTVEAKRQLAQARTFADNEMKSFLTTNLSYNMLKNVTAQATAEFNRVQKIADRKANLADNKTSRTDERQANKEEDDARKAEGMSPVQLARVQALTPGITNIDDGVDPKVKAYKVYLNNKNPKFRAAVDAQGAELPILAVQDNEFAADLVIAEESAKTGFPTEQVKAQLTLLRNMANSNELIDKAIARENKADPKKAREEQAKMKLSMSDPNKKVEVTAQRVRLAMQELQAKRTEVFLGDLSSWNSADPELLLAIDTSKKTTSNAMFDNVMTAYIGDKTGPEAIARASQFRSLMNTAANRYKDSMFGMPSYAEGEAMIAKRVSEGRFWGRFFEQAGKTALQGFPTGDLKKPDTGTGGGGMFPFLGGGDAVVVPIDPATGRKFGE